MTAPDRPTRVSDPVPEGGVRWRSANDPRLSREEILAMLRENRERIGAATAGLDAVSLRRAPGEGEWSLSDILAHVRACADVWGGCIATILAEERPTIRAVGPRTYIHDTNYPDLEFEPSFRAFSEQRAALLEVLEPLPPETWGRTAIVTGAGAALERTMHWYALGLAAHERSHVKHILRIVRAAAARPR